MRMFRHLIEEYSHDLLEENYNYARAVVGSCFFSGTCRFASIYHCTPSETPRMISYSGA